MADRLRIVRREQSARSRQYRGVHTQVIFERDGLEILHTDMEPGSICDSSEFAGFSAAHYVVDGRPVFRTLQECAGLVPGDSVIIPDDAEYTISNGAPAHSIFLSVLFKPCATDIQSTQMAAKETLA